jgi:hypothetical protein
VRYLIRIVIVTLVAYTLRPVVRQRSRSIFVR